MMDCLGLWDCEWSDWSIRCYLYVDSEAKVTCFYTPEERIEAAVPEWITRSDSYLVRLDIQPYSIHLHKQHCWRNGSSRSN